MCSLQVTVTPNRIIDGKERSAQVSTSKFKSLCSVWVLLPQSLTAKDLFLLRFFTGTIRSSTVFHNLSEYFCTQFGQRDLFDLFDETPAVCLTLNCRGSLVLIKLYSDYLLGVHPFQIGNFPRKGWYSPGVSGQHAVVLHTDH